MPILPSTRVGRTNERMPCARKLYLGFASVGASPVTRSNLKALALSGFSGIFVLDVSRRHVGEGNRTASRHLLVAGDQRKSEGAMPPTTPEGGVSPSKFGPERRTELLSHNAAAFTCRRPQDTGNNRHLHLGFSKVDPASSINRSTISSRIVQKHIRRPDQNEFAFRRRVRPKHPSPRTPRRWPSCVPGRAMAAL